MKVSETAASARKIRVHGGGPLPLADQIRQRMLQKGPNRMTHFREAQYFRQPWMLLLLAAIAVPVWCLFIRQMVLGIPFGNLPLPEALLILMTAGATLTALWLWKVHLLTEVRENELRVTFVLLWRPRSIAFDEIINAEAVTYNPIGDYGGWGVRTGRKGGAYNVSGNRGVQLELRGRERLLIGSQLPEELARVLNERMSLTSRARGPDTPAAL